MPELCFPGDIWYLIKDFQLDYKNTHKLKLNPILNNAFLYKSCPVFEMRVVKFPFPQTQTHPHMHPNIDLEYKLSSVSWAPAAWNGDPNPGWCCGYGWRKTIYPRSKGCGRPSLLGLCKSYSD